MVTYVHSSFGYRVTYKMTDQKMQFKPSKAFSDAPFVLFLASASLGFSMLLLASFVLHICAALFTITALCFCSLSIVSCGIVYWQWRDSQHEAILVCDGPGREPGDFISLLHVCLMRKVITIVGTRGNIPQPCGKFKRHAPKPRPLKFMGMILACGYVNTSLIFWLFGWKFIPGNGECCWCLWDKSMVMSNN